MAKLPRRWSLGEVKEMFFKETGYMELSAYARFAGIALEEAEEEKQPASPQKMQHLLFQAWQAGGEEYDRLMEIGKRFDLLPAERYFLFLSVLPHWDSRFGQMFSLFGGGDGACTVVLARDMWETNHGEKATIRKDRFALFFLEDDALLLPKPHLVSYLSGVWAREEKKEEKTFDFLSPRAQQVFEQVKESQRPLVFYGPKGIGKKTCFTLLAKQKGLSPLFLAEESDAQEALFLAVMEQKAVAFLEHWDDKTIAPYLPYLPYYGWICEQRPKQQDALAVYFSPLDMQERYDCWKEAAKGFALSSKIHLRTLANQYALSPGEIRRCLCAAYQKQTLLGQAEMEKEVLYEAIHDLFSHQFESRARRVPCQYGWDDLVLPPRQKEKMVECCQQISLRHIVMEQWNLGQSLWAKGVPVLFYGPPGTGKTMAAQVIASQLGMELYKAELSSVVSKYIGETEKNLKRVFADAKKSQAILFFDEADALFGKRTEVKDSHDKYSNMEAAFLLQEMEQYQGVVILATNLMDNMDEAFWRRMKFIIEFPFPAAPQRKEIWQRAIPKAMPLSADVDLDFLAERFELTGSNIKNAVYGAAFLAAAKEEPVGMREFLLAIQREYEKTGKLFSEADAGIYGAYLR